jgi:hypothetical protein
MRAVTLAALVALPVLTVAVATLVVELPPLTVISGVLGATVPVVMIYVVLTSDESASA